MESKKISQGSLSITVRGVFAKQVNTDMFLTKSQLRETLGTWGDRASLTTKGNIITIKGNGDLLEALKKQLEEKHAELMECLTLSLGELT